jgi:alanyl-tRNA synthetase
VRVATRKTEFAEQTGADSPATSPSNSTTPSASPSTSPNCFAPSAVSRWTCRVSKSSWSKQQERSRAAQKSNIVRALDISTEAVTEFLGFDPTNAKPPSSKSIRRKTRSSSSPTRPSSTPKWAARPATPALVASTARHPRHRRPTNRQGPRAGRISTLTKSIITISPGDKVTLKIDTARRRPIEAHHTATHLLHWALHEVVSKDAAQQGSSVDEHRLRFDFNSAASPRSNSR